MNTKEQQKSGLLEFNKDQFINIKDISIIELEEKYKPNNRICLSIKITLRYGKEIKKSIGSFSDPEYCDSSKVVERDEVYTKARAELNSLKEKISGEY